MHNFTFNGVSLSQFLGRIVQAPFHTVANRNVEFVKIYGQSGDEIIDNESYDNVDFSINIAFLPLLSQRTAQELAYAIIDWLAPLQNGYYIYRDTYNPGYYTKAVLKNITDIQRELPTYLTATLEFNRVPFWYRDDGATAVEMEPGETLALINPELYTSEPIMSFSYTGNVTSSLSGRIVLNNIRIYTINTAAGIKRFIYDGVLKQNYGIEDTTNKKIYLTTSPPTFPVGTIDLTVRPMSGTGVAFDGNFEFSVIPNWRRL